MVRLISWFMLWFILFLLSCNNTSVSPDMISSQDVIVSSPYVKERIQYGPGIHQFGDLYIPDTAGVHPVIVLVHGGCWLSIYGLDLMEPMADSLVRDGYAVWNLEYRRVGDEGGGWPGTFLDIGHGIGYLRTLVSTYALDTTNVIVMGHSAGGHLSLWYGGIGLVPGSSAIKVQDALQIRGIVSLAGIVDLEAYLAPTGCGSNVSALIGGQPTTYPERYAAASPNQLLPLCVPQVLITGDLDFIVPVDHVTPYAEAAKAAGDRIEAITVPGADHFDVIDPQSKVWPIVLQAIDDLLET